LKPCRQEIIKILVFLQKKAFFFDKTTLDGYVFSVFERKIAILTRKYGGLH
jgi:hypothetical protein